MKPLVIVGGGLAGLSLGIALRREGVPVTIVEAGRYPRHRVCGEFVSGRGREALRQLGLEDKLRSLGATEASSAAFYSRTAASGVRALPQPALCLSRALMDEGLAREFQALGGSLIEGERWTGGFDPGVVRATGRRTGNDAAGWRWFGLKSHVRGARMEADVEIHLTDNGYVGLCRLDARTANVCGLFRSRSTEPDLTRTWKSRLSGGEGSTLRRRLAGAEFLDETFTAVAALSLRPQRAANREECSIGDAITMIAPLTGNGMSMAFESAQLAVEPLARYSAGGIDWPETRSAVADSCDRAFRRRLFVSRWLQVGFFRPRVAAGLLWLGGRSTFFWRQAFRLTR